MPLRSTTARRLKTATGAVDVSAAAAPSVGQALVATSPTEATWQNIIAGVSPTYTAKNYMPVNAASTPLAVFMSSKKALVRGDADFAPDSKFLGFLKNDYSALTGKLPSFLNGDGTGTGTSMSFTANAGNNRVLIIACVNASSSAAPTSATWNGNAMTLVETIVYEGGTWRLTIFVTPIGTSGSNQASTITLSGGAACQNIIAGVWVDVDQTNPYGDYEKATNDAHGSATTPSIAHLQGHGLYIGIAQSNAISGTTAGWTQRAGATPLQMGDYTDYSGATFGATGTFRLAVAGFSLNSSIAGDDAILHLAGVVTGFTGLTAGEKYYLQNTVGTIGLTPTAILVGKAVSDTELLIVHD